MESNVFNADDVASRLVPSEAKTSVFRVVIADSFSPILGSRRLSHVSVPSPLASIRTYGAILSSESYHRLNVEMVPVGASS